MSLAEADAMLGPGHSSRFEANDSFADQASLESLARWCQRYSPWVSLDSAHPPEDLFLDIAGCAHLWGGEHGLADTIQRELAQYHLRAKVAIADHVGSAWAWAHFAEKSGGILPPGQASSAVATLPVSALRLSDEMVDLLHKLGIDRVGQLETLARDSVIARLGEQMITRLDQAMGRRHERLQPMNPPIEWRERWNLEYPVAHTSAVLSIVEPLLRSAMNQLPVGWGVVQFEVTLHHEETTDSSRLPIGLCQPSQTLSHLLGLLRLALERTRLAGPVTGVLLHVTRAAPLEWLQPALFETEGTASRRELNGLIDQLSNRLGRHQVVIPRYVPDAQPERACEYKPALGEKLRERGKGTPSSPLSRRPIRLFRQPQPVDVHVTHPSGVPATYQCGRFLESIAHAWGPERIETGWWRDQPIGRDYYLIELASGSRLWIFRDLSTRRWFLHGAFD
jgi:protein ImuB